MGDLSFNMYSLIHGFFLKSALKFRVFKKLLIMYKEQTRPIHPTTPTTLLNIFDKN